MDHTKLKEWVCSNVVGVVPKALNRKEERISEGLEGETSNAMECIRRGIKYGLKFGCLHRVGPDHAD